MKLDFTPKMALAFPGRAGPLRGPASLINALPALGEARATEAQPSSYSVSFSIKLAVFRQRQG